MILPVLFLLAWCVLIANWMGNVDAKAIALNKPIDHASGLVEFVILVGLGYAGAGIWATVVTHNKGPLYFLSFAPMAWAAFTMSFRYLLNRKRGLPWWYVAPWSSRYDLLYYCIIMRRWRTPTVWLREVEHLYARKEPVIVDNIRRSGKVAYTFEALVFLASLLWIISQLPTDH